MSDTQQAPVQQLHEDKQMLNLLYEDAMQMPDTPERREELGSIWQMAGEIALQEQVELQVAADIARGKELAAARRGSKEQELGPQTYQIGKDSIGWLTDTDTPVELTEHMTSQGKRFWMGRVSERSNRTSIDTSFIPEGRMPELLDVITGHIAEKLDAEPGQRTALRSMRASDDTKKHTKLNPYSDASIVLPGFRPGDIRSLILEDPKGATAGTEPVYLLASACRHDEDARKIYQL